MSLRAALLVAVAVFVATIAVRLPTRAALPLLPASLSCEGPAGTVWQGSCTQLRNGPLTLSGVAWTVHPAALLGLHLSAQVASTDPRANGQASIVLSAGQQLEIRSLSGQLDLRSGLGGLPRGVGGTLQANLSHALLEHGELLALVGTVRVVQLHLDYPAVDLGSFELEFPPTDSAASGSIDGQLRDLGGPLSVSGQLQLLHAGGYNLAGWVAARDQAPSDLQQALQLLGPPDAQGRRMFSLAGSLY